MGLVQDLRRVLDALDAEGVPHMLVGGLALESLGMPRTTLDIDIQLLAPPGLRRERSVVFGCVVEEWARDEVFGQDTLIAHLGTSAIPVEFFLTGHWFTRQALDRRQVIRSASLAREVAIPRPEDFVLLKTCYLASAGRRAAKRAQDALDVQSVAAAFPLDRAYLRGNAEKLGVWDALAPLLAP